MSHPTAPLVPPESTVPTKYWHQSEDGRIQCDMCPRLLVGSPG